MSKFRSQSTISKTRSTTNTHIHANAHSNTHSNAHAHKHSNAHSNAHAHKYHYYHYYMRNIIILCCIVFSIYVLYKLFKYTYNYIYKSNTDGYTTLTTQGNEDPNTKFTVGFTVNCANDVIYQEVNMPVPIPGTLFLLGSGLLGLISIKRKITKEKNYGKEVRNLV